MSGLARLWAEAVTRLSLFIEGIVTRRPPDRRS
jgi:hypothetical protein